jgi:DNA primase
MAFSPDLLDEIRTRIPVSDVCARRIKLNRRGREFVGLSPFNHEKTPSFTVNDQKGFYHCFSSGKHGDIFSFVMETEGLSFPEAVEKLAGEAGVELPRLTSEDQAREKRRASLHEVVEAACGWYEARLFGSDGAAALRYLHDRGLDDATIRRFRLGYAPDGSGLARALKQRGIDEALMVEAGLLRRPDDGRAAFAFFRERVMFPIADARGRIIAFGGRMMGEAKAAKYINSPDTLLFDKGRTLYNLAPARQAAHDTGRLLVTEGYMDVIALVAAGFEAAVAPLGTALTELQIKALWRLTPEPILCFDGDAAGQRAADRAAERALPLLEPGRSLRFAYLPAGQDPDTLIHGAGPAAMEAVIQNARPLVAVVWEMEARAGPVDTPERRADFERRLRGHVGQIADQTVRHHYGEDFRGRLNRAFEVRRRGAGPVRRDGKTNGLKSLPSRVNLAGLTVGGARRRQEVLIAALVNHIGLLATFEDALMRVALDPDVEELIREINQLYSITPDLDTGTLRRHLSGTSVSGFLNRILGRDVLLHAGFARPGASDEDAEAGIRDLLASMARVGRRRELREQGRQAEAEGTVEGEARFLRIRDEILRDEQGEPDLGN